MGMKEQIVSRAKAKLRLLIQRGNTLSMVARKGTSPLRF